MPSRMKLKQLIFTHWLPPEFGSEILRRYFIVFEPSAWAQREEGGNGGLAEAARSPAFANDLVRWMDLQILRVASARLSQKPERPLPDAPAECVEKIGSLQISAWAGTLTGPTVPSAEPWRTSIW